ncbi:MAG: hypothetical protein A2W33_04465 [Chloroflexi bacterium RBG_16_52_11]|nr:MAG: hypothetical protein A2W33_04465 [Chloroflexi bacterium RBG_16_52_11]
MVDFGALFRKVLIIAPYFHIKDNSSSEGKEMPVISGAGFPHVPLKHLQSLSMMLLIQAIAV